MHRVLVLSALLTVAGSASAESDLDPARYGWYADYAAATAEAQRTGKPIFLVFRCEP
jgi:hypothetical protein